MRIKVAVMIPEEAVMVAVIVAVMVAVMLAVMVAVNEVEQKSTKP